MNEQGKVFLKQRPEHANLSIDALRERLEMGNNNPTLQDLNRFIANIPGTPSYWKDACTGLLAIIKGKKAPTLFQTFTFADNYDPYLHKLLKIAPGASLSVIRQTMLRQCAIVESFLVKKFEIFREEVLVKLYGCHPDNGGWYWGRAEWQHRGTLHYHYLLRLGENLPDPYQLTINCLKGFELKQTIIDNNAAGCLTEQQQSVIDLKKHSEQELVRFNDFLLSSDVSESIVTYRPPSNDQQRPMNKKCIDIEPEDVAKDILDLVMVCNCHARCRRGTCIKVFRNVPGKCKSKFPKPMSASKYFLI